MKKIFTLIISILMLFLNFSCSNNNSRNSGRVKLTTKLYKKNHIVRIAVAGNLTSMDELKKGAELAVEQINSNGGIKGAKLEIVYFDDKNDLEQGKKNAYEIVKDESICAVIGHSNEEITREVSIIYNFYGILQFSPICASSIISKNGFKYLFRNINDVTVDPKLVVDFMKKSSFKNILIFSSEDYIYQNATDELEKHLCYQKINIVDKILFDNNDSIESLINKIENLKYNTNVDCIYVAASGYDAANIITLIRQEGLNQIVIGNSKLSIDLFDIFKTNIKLKNIYATYNHSITSEYEPLVKARKLLKEKYNTVSSFYEVQIYDAISVLSKAIEMADSPSTELLSKVLRENEWQEAAGPYRFDENGKKLGEPMVMEKLF